MGIEYSPSVVTSDLAFYYDMGNTRKSFRGRPTTNFFTNGHFSNGNGIVQEAGSNPTNTVISLPNNPGETSFVLEQSMGIAFTEYQINLTTELLPSTTYVMSGWYAESSDYTSLDGSRMFHSRAFSASGANTATGNGIGNIIETRIINNITWRYCYETITTPSDYSNSFNWYLGYGNNSYTGRRYYTNIQMEQGTYPSRFVNGTRSNTQAILDLTGNNTITATSLTYANDGTFSFNGGNFITIPNTQLGNGNVQWTVNAWVRTTTTTNELGNGSVMSNSSGGPVYSMLGVNNGRIVYWTYQNNAWSQKLSTGKIVNDNVWHMLTWVNYANNTMDMYVDGVQDFFVANSTSGNNNPVDKIGGSWNSNFVGSIAAVSRYTRALTAEEVNNNFSALRGRFGV
jgi:hypothetical protein